METQSGGVRSKGGNVNVFSRDPILPVTLSYPKRVHSKGGGTVGVWTEGVSAYAEAMGGPS